MIVSQTPQIRNNLQKEHSSSIERMKDTIQVFYDLVEIGCRPADCSPSLITMRKAEFKDFLNKKSNGMCSRLKTKNGTLYSVWINYIEISYFDYSDNMDWELIKFE
jgi:hypothetical protein